ncbi:MAG: class I SAM-dependent RNA methyltransferase [Sphingorhabdus sp.]|uniref:class I SAM-dependent RNA methyltransferase n=1 Tax=Sphingorhabdus sp. TaxID=1902408 RepID=UPI003CB9DB1C
MTNIDEIIRIASRGDGVTADGRHVPFAAPGDSLNPGGGLVHGPHHVDPPCPHFQLCGGCQLQHLDEEVLKTFAQDRIIHALSAQDLALPEFMPVHISPPHSRRRVAVRSAWAGKQFQLGFSSEKSHRIVDLTQCDIMAPELFAVLEPLRVFLAPRIGPKRNVEIKLALVDQGVDVLIEQWAPDGLETHEALTDFATANNLARLSTDDGYGPTTYWEPEPATATLGGIAVAYPPYGFLQATRDGEQALTLAVQEIVGEAKLAADLFSGLGTFAFAVVQGRKIFAAEAERAALLSMKAAASKAGLSLFAEHRDLFRRPLTPPELNRFAAVILDPPRAGAREQVAELAKSDVPTIAYVSCNPSSFARDAKTLIAGGYRLQRIWPVGQFRWSTHVELAGEFTRQ